MKDLTDADYAAAGVSNHRILQMHGMTDEQRIRFLGVDVIKEVVIGRRLDPIFQRHTMGVFEGAIRQYLRDCDVNRRLGHIT
jgi:hypothetical protein